MCKRLIPLVKGAEKQPLSRQLLGLALRLGSHPHVHILELWHYLGCKHFDGAQHLLVWETREAERSEYVIDSGFPIHFKALRHDFRCTSKQR